MKGNRGVFLSTTNLVYNPLHMFVRWHTPKDVPVSSEAHTFKLLNLS